MRKFEKKRKTGGQGGAGGCLEGEGISGTSGRWSIQDSNPQTGGLATDTRKKHQTTCFRNTQSYRNNKHTAQKPEAPRPLVEDLNLREK